MINVMKMRLFPYFAKQIIIPNNDETPYNVVFMSENSDLLSVYTKLNIRRQFVKQISFVASRMPRVIPTTKDLLPYKKVLGLMPAFKPANMNTFMDTGIFFNKLDELYGKGPYKRPSVLSKVVSYLNDSKNSGGRKSILMYHVDLSKPIAEQFIERRSSILFEIAKIGDGSFPFDAVVLAVERDGSIQFMSLFNKEQKPLDATRIFSILKRLHPSEEIETGEEISESILTESDEEKASIMRFIDKHRKTKVLRS